MADLRIFGKTPKGTEELASRSGALSMAQRRLLILVDGVRDAAQLAAIVPSAFDESLAVLEEGGYIVLVGQSARSAEAAPTPSMSIPESEMTTVHEAKQRAAQEVKDLLGPSAEALAQAMEALTATAMKFLAWFTGGKMELVPLSANRFLEMMAETAIGWLLLEGATVASRKLSDPKTAPAADHPDHAYYIGKICAAQYFARNVLSSVAPKAEMIAREDRSAMDIPEAGFAAL